MVPPAACGYCLPAPQPGVVPPAVIVSTDALPPPPGVVLPACSVGVLWRRQAVRGTPPRVLAQAPGEPGYCRWYCSGGGEGGGRRGGVLRLRGRLRGGPPCGLGTAMWVEGTACSAWVVPRRGGGRGLAPHPPSRGEGSGYGGMADARHVRRQRRGCPALLPAPRGKKSRPCPPGTSGQEVAPLPAPQAHPMAAAPAKEGPAVGWTTGLMVDPAQARQAKNPTVSGVGTPLAPAPGVVVGHRADPARPSPRGGGGPQG